MGQGVKAGEMDEPLASHKKIILKVVWTALNPINCKFNTTSWKWKVGDRVAGFVQSGAGKEHGCFAEYVKADEDLIWRVPEKISHEEASICGVSAVTAVQALNVHLGTEELFTIQLTKKARCTLVTTALLHSFDLVKNYVHDVKKSSSPISRAIDCFSKGDSTKLYAEILQRNNGKVVSLIDSKPKVLVRFYRKLSNLSKWIKSFPVTGLSGGFYGVLEGLDRLRQRKVSGCKLVVKC
ncbi:hypothetical protein BS50DRAFT_605134 [Corynespora cassiicola Philippines]|uniref:Uncharacterized protein n=1 Tax=Corynespora cassiicola Philippines TaxID=1448308 RepID=A0A2T2N2L2_CORCC|nr:hypothetical protein BS50DRAFT_605134 [Corynespora cassiicola Philippines]